MSRLRGRAQCPYLAEEEYCAQRTCRREKGSLLFPLQWYRFEKMVHQMPPLQILAFRPCFFSWKLAFYPWPCPHISHVHVILCALYSLIMINMNLRDNCRTLGLSFPRRREPSKYRYFWVFAFRLHNGSARHLAGAT